MDVARILAFCRPNDRHLLEQQYVNGVTTQEMAREQGVTETAIRIRLLRARRDARSQVERRTLHHIPGVHHAAAMHAAV
jgi:DNA-directed RNA polymerase specialized sigma24 family protein